MKYFLSSICWLFLFLGFMQISSASDAPVNLYLESRSDSQIEVSWDPVEGALGYYIYYGQSSWQDGLYDVEGIELIETAEYTLWDLQPDTQYYIALTALDDTGKESSYSEELAAQTLAFGQASQVEELRLVVTEVVSVNEIMLEFSKSLDNTDETRREFILVDSLQWREIMIEETRLDEEKPHLLFLTLESSLFPETQYDITILDILAVDGATIEQWVEWFWSFVTPEIFPESNMWDELLPELSSAPEENNQDVVEESSQWTTQTSSQEEQWQWVNEVAAETSKLPDTGTEHILLLIIAAIAGLGLYTRMRK